MKRFSVFFIVHALLLFQPATTLPGQPVRIQLKWRHQAQFAGCYVAVEKQFYAAQGLDVVLVEGGPGLNPAQALIDNSAAFSISSPEDLLAHRSRGDSVTSVAAIYRKSAVVFLSRRGSGILRPRDFSGKVIAVESNRGISDFRLQFDALMENLGVDISAMTMVPYDPDYKGFIKGDVDITPAYFTGGLIKLTARDVNVNIIYPGDYRVRFYSDILMTTGRLIAQDPDLVRRVVTATMKGWKYAIDHLDESVPLIMKYARIKDASLQKEMLEAAVPLINTGTNRLGWMTAGEWQHMYRILMNQDILAAPVKNLNAVFTNKFIEKMTSGRAP